MRQACSKVLRHSGFTRAPSFPSALPRFRMPSAATMRSFSGFDVSPKVASNVLPVCPSPGKRLRVEESFASSVTATVPVATPARPAATPTQALNHALKSVVKVFCTVATPSFASPWTMNSQTKITATGFIVEPLESRRILTNAHAVANQCQVQLRKHGSAKKYVAKVLAVGHECDIAMLTVEDDEFWSGASSLAISGLPEMQSSVTVVGFPQGGDNVCVTKGVVSRIDRSTYSHGRTALLAVQIDAAINSGNSGGPVLMGDQVVGIAFQCLTAGENIGYIIPVPVITHFLQDLDRNRGAYTGFCELGASWQSLEAGDMKRWAGMPPGMTGVYVTSTEPVFHASKVLKAGDVLTHVAGHEIADDGTFIFAQDVRIDFRHLVSMAFQGDIMQVKVWRGGRHLELSLVLSTPQQLVPVHSHDARPKYFIYAGMVFTRLTTFYLRSTWGADWSSKAPIKLCDRTFAGTMQAPGQEVVLLSKVLAGEVNTGYQDTANLQVHNVNGVRVHNLAHLAQLLSHVDQPFVKFEMEWNRVIVVDNAKACAMGNDILRQNCIAGPASEGLLTETYTLPASPETVPSMAEAEEVEGVRAEAVGGSGSGAGSETIVIGEGPETTGPQPQGPDAGSGPAPGAQGSAGGAGAVGGDNVGDGADGAGDMQHGCNQGGCHAGGNVSRSSAANTASVRALGYSMAASRM